MTIESLVTLMQREFHGIRKEMSGLATKQELKELRKDMMESLRILQDDVRDIKNTLGPLVRVVAAQDAEIKNLHVRVYRLERKAGLAK